MKKKYIYTTFLSLFVIVGTSAIFFQLSADNDKLSGYDLYLDRNKRICEQYKPQKPLYTSKEFENQSEDNNGTNFDIGGNDLEVAKAQYKETMNSVYKCALLNAQERSILFISETLKQNSKITTFTQEYEAKEKRLKKARADNNCVNSNNTTKQDDKVNVLRQATFEICKYNNYLEYLLEHNSVIANVIAQDKKSSINSGSISSSTSPEQITQTYNISEIANLERSKKEKILSEIDRAYRIYPIVFQAYTEYENNLPLHDLLTMLRNDFIEFRSDLHKNLNPINQVVYKISNAMKE